MLHVTCDLCGKELQASEDHYIVKIEVFAAHDPAGITEADLDRGPHGVGQSGAPRPGTCRRTR